ncbi:carbohydrate binding domain-containing protein [Segatella copri]|nr:carbohydrate binding domain-containing protein [Segatella copri]
MKKYIFSVLMAAMAAFTFSSCEDVPEPYTQPTKPDAGGTTEGEPKGTGTAADPFNSIAAINYCKTLEAGVESDKEVYIKGKVVSIKEQFSTNFGNGSFYIADDESSEKFYIFRSLYLGNKKWTASDPELKEGDEVVVCAKVMNYMGNTPETVANKTYLVSLNGKTADGSGSGDITGTAKGDGSAANPFNSVAAQKYTAALESGVVSDKEFYIKGKVQSIKEQFSASFGNGSFYIADDANSTQFYIFRIYYFGGEKWKEGDMTLKEGDEIVVCAKLINYMGNTPETNQGGKLISVNGKTSTGGGEVKPDPDPKPDPTPGEVTTSENGGFETWADGKPTNWKTVSTAGNATLSQSEDAHSGKYSVKVGGSANANKRLGYKEITLKAGEYKVKFYAKAVSEKGASVCPGIVPVTDGKAGIYIYMVSTLTTSRIQSGN